MVELKKFSLGEPILTNRWKAPFYVEVVHNRVVVAVNRQSVVNPIFLFIHKNIAYYGSTRLSKKLKTKSDMKNMIDKLVGKEIILGFENSCPVSLLLDESAFNIKFAKEQIKDVRESDEY